MRTPRPSTRSSVKTLIGNGWLRESPKNLWPRGWDIKSRSALRKCVFLPVPPEAAAFLKGLPPPKPLEPAPLVAHAVHRTDKPALSPQQIAAAEKNKLLVEARRVAMGKKPRAPADAKEASHAWYDDPIAVGTLLILLPPVGLAAVWSSKRYSTDARWALTVMTGLTMFLVAAVFIALMALSR